MNVVKKVLWIAMVVIAGIIFVVVAASLVVDCAKTPCN